MYITKIVVQHEWNDSTCEIEESFIIIDIYSRLAYIKKQIHELESFWEIMSFPNTIGNSPSTKVLESSPRSTLDWCLGPPSSFWRVSTNRKRVGHEGISSSGLHVWEMFPPRISLVSFFSRLSLWETAQQMERWAAAACCDKHHWRTSHQTVLAYYLLLYDLLTVYFPVLPKKVSKIFAIVIILGLKSIVMVVKHINQSFYDQIIIIISPSVALAR